MFFKQFKRIKFVLMTPNDKHYCNSQIVKSKKKKIVCFTMLYALGKEFNL